MTFESNNAVVVGENNLGSSNVGAVSIMAVDCAGTVGVYVSGVFYPHPDGALAAGEMLTFECGSGRALGFNATTGGTLTISRV